MRSTRYKAAVALGLATAGFITSYPYSVSFYGGMINSGCWAAMVGGLADWFAVTALFRKPLGFSYRTAIIPRNRERIFNDLITFIEKDLLTKDNILKTLSHYDVAELLIRYLEEHQGKQGAKEIAQRVIQDVWGRLDANDFGRMIEDLIKDHASRVKISPVLAETLEWAVKNGYDERIIDFVLDELLRVVGDSEKRAVLSGLFEAVKGEYERGMKRNKFVSWLLDISSDKLVDIARDKLIEYLQDLKNPSHPLRSKLKEWIVDIIAQLKANREFQEKVETWKSEVIHTKLSIRYQIGHYVRYLRQTTNTLSEEKDSGIQNLNSVIDQWVDNFKESSNQKSAFDSWVKHKLETFIDQYHNHVSIIVRERLGEFTDELLVEFIETKVGDDLQMIRINGSLVGGLVGILLYFLTYGLERLW